MVGAGVVHSGAVAGFPLPVLRYFVGSGQPGENIALSLLTPVENASVASAFCRRRFLSVANKTRQKNVGQKNKDHIQKALFPDKKIMT